MRLAVKPKLFPYKEIDPARRITQAMFIDSAIIFPFSTLQAARCGMESSIQISVYLCYISIIRRLIKLMSDKNINYVSSITFFFLFGMEVHSTRDKKWQYFHSER